MASEIVVTIRNWEKFNPRKDVKNATWFRLGHDLFENPDFYDFTHSELVAWLYLLTVASRKSSSAFTVNIQHAHRIARLDEKVFIHALKKLSKIRCIEMRTVRGRYADGTFAAATNETERTNETNETNETEKQVCTEPEPGGSVIGAISPITRHPRVNEILRERKVPLDTQKAWVDAYPDPSWIEREILKAIAWERENPAKRKRHFSRFMGRWLSRGWDPHTARIPKTAINTTPIRLDEGN